MYNRSDPNNRAVGPRPVRAEKCRATLCCNADAHRCAEFSYAAIVNKAHEACGSDEWRQAIREVILPWALGETDLGYDVLEVGPGYGATTDVLSQSVPRLTSVEIDDELAAMLVDRFADVPSVQIVHGDATSLPYADNSFSGAACCITFRPSHCRTGCSRRSPACCGPELR